MSHPDAYIREINSLSQALSRINAQAKSLRQKKRLAESRLYTWMVNHGKDDYKNYKAAKLAPKQKAPRKKEKEKAEDAIRLLTEMGLPDPEDAWQRIRDTQKAPRIVDLDE